MRAHLAPGRVSIFTAFLLVALSFPAPGAEPDTETEVEGYFGAVPKIPREKAAAPLKSVAPFYPVQARRFNVQGAVVARVQIGLRTRTAAPANAAEINQPVVSGWSEMRLMIDAAGAVMEHLVVRSSSPEFAAVAEKIAGGFTFEGIEVTKKNRRDIYVNAFRIEMNYDGTIAVFQRVGT